MDITKEEWLEFKSHVGYKVLVEMLKNTVSNNERALGSGITLGENIVQDTANIVGRISAYNDVLEFNPIEEIDQDESRSDWVPSYR